MGFKPEIALILNRLCCTLYIINLACLSSSFTIAFRVVLIQILLYYFIFYIIFLETVCVDNFSIIFLNYSIL